MRHFGWLLSRLPALPWVFQTFLRVCGGGVARWQPPPFTNEIPVEWENNGRVIHMTDDHFEGYRAKVHCSSAHASHAFLAAPPSQGRERLCVRRVSATRRRERGSEVVRRENGDVEWPEPRGQIGWRRVCQRCGGVPTRGALLSHRGCSVGAAACRPSLPAGRRSSSSPSSTRRGAATARCVVWSVQRWGSRVAVVR